MRPHGCPPHRSSLLALVLFACSGYAPADESAGAVWPAPAPPFTDFRFETPGRSHRITIQDLPSPYASAAASNPATIVPRPAALLPRAPEGFTVSLYVAGLSGPRVIRIAPNGDIFIAEAGAGQIRVLRPGSGLAEPQRTAVFATQLNQPYGMAFYPAGRHPRWLYVGDTDAILRFRYRDGDLRARAPPERLAALPTGGHWTRDLAFSADGSTLFVAVGSASNVDDPDTSPRETQRANILAFDPDGSKPRVYASGLRNPSGLAVDPADGHLWCVVNERDGLGDDLVPDYITAVQAGGFYGWPWWYLGPHQDPRHEGKHAELKSQVIVPDVLLQPHDAPLQLSFYDAGRFPAQYHGDIFATSHGSWNRAVRTGYEVVRVPRHQSGHAAGDYEDFLTGFVLPDGTVWGRPVGIAVAADGALLVSDDASGSIWRVDYTGP